QLRTERGRPPVGRDRLPDLLTERVRRDRAVGARSERALIEQRRERCEELALSRTPFGRTAHRLIEGVGERPSEEFGPVEERLHHAQRLCAASLANRLQDSCLRRIMPMIRDLEPHAITRCAASSLRNPSEMATVTVASKISSSGIPARLSSSTS